VLHLKSTVRVVALAGMVAGCSVGPDYHTPKSDLPTAFGAAFGIPGGQQPQPAFAGESRWWESFKDPELTSLVQRAIAQNLDLQIAVARLEAAQAAESVVIGVALPELGAGAAAGIGTGSDLTRGRLAPGLVSADNRNGSRITQLIGFDAGWELDLFGQIRREIEAAKYDKQAALEARSDVLISVISDVVRAYFDLRGFQMRLAALNQSVSTAQQSLAFVQSRFNIGITNQLDVALAQRQLATLQAQVGPLTSQISAARYSIATLIGQYPEIMDQELATPAMIPALPASVGVGLPIELLNRRPDIRQAERQLAASTARIGVATGNLFPHVSLTAGVGLQGPRGPSSSANNLIWSAGPAGVLSLLDFGTLDAEVEIADFTSKQYLLKYKQTILQAVQQIDAAIEDYSEEQNSLKNLEEALAASQLALSLASERYDRGLTDFLNVLDAEREEYLLEDQYASEQRAAGDALVGLYRGLGGGWEDYQSLPSIPQPQPAVIAAFRRLFDPHVGN
jgi:NodT family efflux transporter outer membrane factor (OMF) lipoprotein